MPPVPPLPPGTPLLQRRGAASGLAEGLRARREGPTWNLQPLCACNHFPAHPGGGGPQLPRLRGDISASLTDAPQAVARRPERVRSQEPGRRAKHRRARSKKASWKENICLQARCPFFRLVCELWHSKARGPRARRPEKRGEPERVADRRAAWWGSWAGDSWWQPGDLLPGGWHCQGNVPSAVPEGSGSAPPTASQRLQGLASD